MADRVTETKSEGVSAPSPSVLLFVETSREFGRGLLHGIARYSRLHGPWRVLEKRFKAILHRSVH